MTRDEVGAAWLLTRDAITAACEAYDALRRLQGQLDSGLPADGTATEAEERLGEAIDRASEARSTLRGDRKRGCGVG